MLWIGKFSIVDVFDTNKYANNPKTDFMNWALINAGTFDYAGDAWGYTYGAAAEWYQGHFTVRAGAFDLSASPAGGGNNAQAYGLDPTFQQFELVGEIEERHELWGQPGKLKVTGYLERGNMGTFSDAIAAFATAGAAVWRSDGRAGGGAAISEPAGREPQSRTASQRQLGRVCPCRLGGRHQRAMGLHRHRSHGAGRRFHQRQVMEPAGRHDRRCRHRQRA